MSYHEKRSISTILSTLIYFVIYTIIVLKRYSAKELMTTNDLKLWAIIILVMMLASIIVRIITTIVFTIYYRITSQEEEPQITDERDKLFELKGNRNSLYVFSIGFLIAMIAVALGQPLTMMFFILVLAGFGSDLVGEVSTLYFYRRGY